MERRDFLKKSLAMGLGAGVMLLPNGLKGLVAKALADEPGSVLVALQGSSPEAMFDRGIAALGGMGRFVAAGQTVLVKPNISWDVSVSGAANTHPGLVGRIIAHCLDAGARRVHVMDHSIEYWERSLETSGIGGAVRAAGGTYVQAEDARYYRQVDVNGAALKTTQVHESWLDSDVLINVPVLKHHGGATVSSAMKNLMGCVWNRREYHSKGLQACIADFLRVRKPDLNVVDAYRVLTRNGPRGGSPNDITEMNAQLISADIVAADAAATRLLGRNPSDIRHIRLAAEGGFGMIDLTKVNIERISL